MSDEGLAEDSADDDFRRWFVGGSPPESADWPPHAFEAALFGQPFVDFSRNDRPPTLLSGLAEAEELTDANVSRHGRDAGRR